MNNEETKLQLELKLKEWETVKMEYIKQAELYERELREIDTAFYNGVVFGYSNCIDSLKMLIFNLDK